MARTMCSTVSIVSAIYFIFIQVISMNIASVESSTPNNNSTDHIIQWRSDRTKRSPEVMILDRLQIQVKYPTGEKVELNWIKIDQYLANKYLPVIMSSDYSKTNVMDDVGDFVIYHDVEKCSAVVYFKKSHTIFGVIGLDYIITDLPYKFDSDGYYPGIVGEPHLTNRVGTTVYNHPQTMDELEESDDISPCDAAKNSKHLSNSDSDLKKNHHRKARYVHEKSYGNVLNTSVPKIRKRREDVDQEYYLETLLFVTSDVLEFFKVMYGTDINIEWVVRYYILYFNAIDMIFQNIRSSEMGLRINIAKIVIEDVSKPFEFLSDGELQFSETVKKLRSYLQANQNIYTLDSFDHVFISTRRTIMDHSIVPVAGVSEYGADLFSAREQEEFYQAVPITVVGFLYDYSIGVHEISRTFDIDTDSWVDILARTGQCSSIMQEGGSKCERCLKWNDNSKEQFKVFFRTNQNRCFLLNEPRSIRHPGPSKFVTPLKQCRCFGYHSFAPKNHGEPSDNVNPDECDAPLQCTRLDGDQGSCDHAILPFDGTTCGDNKVCWNQKCVRYKRKRCSQKKKVPRKSM